MWRINNKPSQILGDAAKMSTQDGVKLMIVVLVLSIAITSSASASITCHGHFVNPVTDICWSCLMPLSVGGISVGKGIAPAKRDRVNPKLCVQRIMSLFLEYQ